MKKIIYISILLASFANFNCDNLYHDTTSRIPAASIGLMTYYTFNGNANDSSGSYHGTVQGGAVLAADRYGRSNSAYDFDGTDDYITTGITDLSGNFTLSVWIYPDVSQTGAIISKQTDESNNLDYAEFSLRIDTYSFLELVLGKSNAESEIRNVDSVENNTWYHIIVTYDGSYINCYVNGSFTGFSLLRSEERRTGSNQLRIGAHRYNGSVTDAFKGTIDDVRIYNRALSMEEITELYNREKL
ncbi:MAG: LamG domain-containing protein [bacterium]|nr:LamG domain-containing protein [bacterium]